MVNCFNILFGSIPGIVDSGIVMLGGAITDNMEDIKELFSTSLNEVSDKMIEIGKFIIMGLVNGLQASVQWVLGFIGQFVTNLIAWIMTNIRSKFLVVEI